MKAINRILIPLVAFSAAAPVLAQPSRFKTGVAAVRVDALVTDGKRIVTGLTAADFELRDNGVLQKITDLSRETLPLNVISVLDLSGSVAGSPLAQLKEAMSGLIDALEPKDRAALITFAERLQLHATLTDDRARLKQLLTDVKAGGNTALLDAAFAGLALRESDDGRTLLLLFSDGRDTASWLTARKVLDMARRTDVVVYPITVRPMMFPMLGIPRLPLSGRGPGRARTPVDPAQELLEAFADDTGGRVFFADSETALRSTFVNVLAEFRQRYVLSYTPNGVATDGWHTLEVKLRGRSGQVKARRGYFARPATPDRETRTPSR